MNFPFKKTIRLLIAGLVDRSAQPDNRKVAFVIKRTVPFSGNVRALADALQSQGGYQLVVYKDGPLGDAGDFWRTQGARVYEKFSVEALRDVMSAGTVILSHSGRDAMLSRKKPGRRVINLWHGVAIKRIEHLMPGGDQSPGAQNRRYLMRVNSKLYDAMIASSDIDRMANALAFGVDYEKVHVTGLPRFDYLAQHYVFPADLQRDADRLTALLKGRRLVLYAPTFREDGPSALTLLQSDVLQGLKDFLRAHDLVLGIRPHPYDQKALAAICDGEQIIDLRPDLYAEPAIPLRAAAALVVDYSSIWVDYLLLKRPIIALVPDIEHYTLQERGFIYDFSTVFPGPMLSDWDGVMRALQSLVTSDFVVPFSDVHRYWQAENMFLPPAHLRFKSTDACMDIFFGSNPVPPQLTTTHQIADAG